MFLRETFFCDHQVGRLYHRGNSLHPIHPAHLRMVVCMNLSESSVSPCLKVMVSGERECAKGVVGKIFPDRLMDILVPKP